MPQSPATDMLTKAEEKDLKVLGQQAHIPVKEIKAVPKAPEEKSPQDKFNEDMKKLSKTILDILHGGSDVKVEQINRVVKNTLKHAHQVRYVTKDSPVEFNPLEP